MLKRLIPRKLILILIAILFILVETSVFPVFSLTATYPNLLIILTCIVGFLGGKREGMYAGLICGLLIDLTSGSYLGFHTLVLMYAGYINGMFNKVLFNEDVLFPIALVSVTDLVYNVIYFIFYFMMRNKLNLGYYIVNTILPEVIFTAVVTLFTYKIFLRISNKLENYEKGSVIEND